METASLAKRIWDPWGRRVVTTVFLLLVAALVVRQARSIAWGDVWQSLGEYQASTLVLAAVLAATSHLLFSSFDLLARIYTRHRLRRAQVLIVAAVCYAFTLNFGALIGGVGFRYRLYSRLGLDSGVITRIYAFAFTANWLGYLILGGAVFATGQLEIPEAWSAGTRAMQVIGGLMLALAAAYFALCGMARRRHWTVRGHEIALPSLRMAAVQAVASVCNWLLMAAIIYVLLGRGVDLATVTAVLMVSAIAGVMAHVPAGLGVLEAVFIALLGERMPAHQLLAGLLGYRALYYLCPLVIGAVLYLATEARAGRQRRERGEAERRDPAMKAVAQR